MLAHKSLREFASMPHITCLMCREQILEEVDNIANANPHIMKVCIWLDAGAPRARINQFSQTLH